MDSEISTSKGLLMELIVYYLHSKKEPLPDKIDWHEYYEPDIEFDVIFKKGEEITFCECKWSNSSGKKNLNEKISSVKNNQKFINKWGEIKEDNIKKIYFSFKEDQRGRESKEKQGYIVLSVKENFNEIYPEFKEKIKRFKHLSADLDRDLDEDF